MGTRFDDYLNESAASDTEAGRAMSAAFRAHYDAVHEAQFELGHVVAARRAERGLTQAQLAAQSGVPQPEISKIEASKANPTAATLRKLGEPLGLELRFVEV
jgi:ribosome-binding protein aMBF1 (putative translation factor)